MKAKNYIQDFYNDEKEVGIKMAVENAIERIFKKLEDLEKEIRER